MRKALTLMATIVAALALTVGVAGAQDYTGVGGEGETPPPTAPAPTAPVTQAPGVGAGAAAPGAAAPGTLPRTGGNSVPVAQIAVGMAALGGMALLIARRTPAEVKS
jgi:LPXTG-motif cell wall-anchored protein